MCPYRTARIVVHCAAFGLCSGARVDAELKKKKVRKKVARARALTWKSEIPGTRAYDAFLRVDGDIVIFTRARMQRCIRMTVTPGRIPTRGRHTLGGTQA